MLIEEIMALPFPDALNRLTIPYYPVDAKVTSLERTASDILKYREQWEGTHSILNQASKTVGTGKESRLVVPNKLVLTYQKKIVELAIAFLLGNPPKIKLKIQDDRYSLPLQSIQTVWDDNKLDYFNKELMRTVCIETHAAELWYIIKPDLSLPSVIGTILLSEGRGDMLYPHFDDYGKMDAFTRKYSVQTIDKKVRQLVDIYTVLKIYHAEQISGAWSVTDEINLVGKIPIIYYKQVTPEWYDVESLIERYETSISKHGDTNDYFAAPIPVISGKLVNAPDKDKVGKSIQLRGERNPNNGNMEYGNVAYLTWDNSPDSIKLEQQTLKSEIMGLTDTPDIDFNSLKTIGTVSGIALKLMFLGATMKAKNKEELYGECFGRRLNLIKAMLTLTSMKDKVIYDEMKTYVEFQSIIPENLKELMDTLSIGRGGAPVMSEQTALKNNPFVTDVTVEEQQIADESSNSNSLTGSSFGV